MRVLQMFERRAFVDLADFVVGPAELLRRGCDELLREDVVLAVVLDDCVIEVGLHRDGEIRRQRPGRGGPDDRVQRFLDRKVERGDGFLAHAKAHVDRRRRVLAILDLRLGERGLVIRAPVHGLEAFVDRAGPEETAECIGDVGFVVEGHRGVGMVPVSEDAEADEILALDVDVFRGELAAGAANLGGRHLGALRAELFADGVLDREAVAVPARDVRRVVAEHRARFHDDVFERFIEGVADVNFAVRVGRPVMKDELRAAGGLFANELIEIHAPPLLEPFRLVLRQVGLHREGGLRQVESLLVVAAFGHGTGNLTPRRPHFNGRLAPRARALGAERPHGAPGHSAFIASVDSGARAQTPNA
jgi:hypothetical protein